VRRLLTSSRNCYAVIFGNCTAKFIRDLHNFFRKVARRRTHDSNLYLHIHSSSTVVISLIRYCKALYPFCYTIDRCPAQRRFIYVGDIKQSRLHLLINTKQISSLSKSASGTEYGGICTGRVFQMGINSCLLKRLVCFFWE